MIGKVSIRPGYRWRLGIIGIALLGVSGWFLKDGMYTYPEQQHRYQVQQKIRQEHPDDWQNQWKERTQKEGWSIDHPTDKSDWSIRTQYTCAALSFPFGLLCAVSFVRAGGRWIEADEDGLSTNSGQRVKWADIETVDKSRWQTKGIAVVHYSQNGRPQRITLDDWKFERQKITAMVEEVDEHRSDLIDSAQPSA